MFELCLISKEHDAFKNLNLYFAGVSCAPGSLPEEYESDKNQKGFLQYTALRNSSSGQTSPLIEFLLDRAKSPENHFVAFRKQKMASSEPAEDVAVDRGSLTNKFTVYLRDLMGKMIACSVTETTLVKDLQKQYHRRCLGSELVSTPVIYAGSKLDPERPLSYYKIRDGATVHMVFHLSGGMYHESSGRNNLSVLNTIEVKVLGAGDTFCFVVEFKGSSTLAQFATKLGDELAKNTNENLGAGNPRDGFFVVTAHNVPLSCANPFTETAAQAKLTDIRTLELLFVTGDEGTGTC